MLSKKSYLQISVIVILAVLTLSTFTQAQGYWSCAYDYDMGWWNASVPSQYAYSSEQIDALNKIRAEYDQKISPLIEKLRALRTEFRSFINSTNYNSSDAAEYRRQIIDLESQITNYRIDARKEMSSILTETQRAYFGNSSIGWWNNFYDRCGWDYDNFAYGYNYAPNGGWTSGRCW